jgi:hypothetical protein
MLLLLGLWAGMMVLGFALLQWAVGSAMVTHDGRTGFPIDLYMSGTTFFTLGLGACPSNRCTEESWCYNAIYRT